MNNRREIFGWTMYDWASSAFSTTVGTVFLGPYLTSLAESATASTDGLLYLFNVPIRFDSFFAYCISASVLLQVTILPILGALADYSHLRKRMLMFFSTLGAVATIAMFFIGADGYWLGGMLFIIANVCFGASIVFYNAYLPDIAAPETRDAVSSRGFAMGYAGGGILLLLNLILYMFGDNLGLGSAMVARISLASAGVWWLGFSLITFVTLHQRHTVRALPPGENYLSVGFAQLARLLGVSTRLVTILTVMPLLIPVLVILGTPILIALTPALGPIAILVIFMVKKSKTLPQGVKYLLAYLLYNDGIQTVINIAAIYAAIELGMATTMLILVILMIQFVAFGGAFLFAFVASRLGARNAIIISLFIWAGVVIYAWLGMTSQAPIFGMEQRQFEFWVLGFVIALVLGGSQALSRSLFSQMIPKGQEAEFFSFYEVSERGTSWLGPFVFGVVNQMTGSLRVGLLSVIIFFVIGLALLFTVNVPQAVHEAKAEEKPEPAAVAV
ncbi:MAG: MFS transporter [Anaerolineae bacterium]|nr:MFS transporter [Anaerolineae bacterium]